MKRRDLLKHLRAYNCELHREGSKHSLWVHISQKKYSSIPRHNEINDILVKKICKDLGIPAVSK